MDGSTDFLKFNQWPLHDGLPMRGQYQRPWVDHTNTEQTVLIHVAAKKNLKMREWLEAQGRPDTQLPEFLRGANFSSQVWNDMGDHELSKWLATVSTMPEDIDEEEQQQVASAEAIDTSATL